MKKLRKIDGSCAVCALCYVSGLDQETVLRVCALHGFEAGRGMFDEEWQDAAEHLGLKFRKVPESECRLKTFMSKYKKGLYLVGTIDHIFVLDNGIIIDPKEDKEGMGRIVKGAWRVSN